MIDSSILIKSKIDFLYQTIDVLISRNAPRHRFTIYFIFYTKKWMFWYRNIEFLYNPPPPPPISWYQKWILFFLYKNQSDLLISSVDIFFNTKILDWFFLYREFSFHIENSFFLYQIILFYIENSNSWCKKSRIFEKKNQKQKRIHIKRLI